ncbi:MAG: tetratricopeptide repeat protein [Treponema sp.]|nr:MAG: tetratricopeptide repeat protein [Treponema sp.]
MEDKEIVLRRAKNAVISRDFNLAIRLYKSLLQEDVKNIEYLSALGNLYMKNNDDEKALPYFQQILTFYPNNFEAMNSMGGIYRRMGRYQESIEILQKALETKINPAQVNYNLGFTYKLMKNYSEAIDAFENVIAVNPTDVLAYNHLGTIYAAQNNHEKAVATYKRGLQIDPNHPIIQFNLAKSLEAMHDDTSAIQAYDAALRAKPGWQEAVIEYAKLLLNHRKTRLAGELVQNAIGLHPQDFGLYAQMGQILMRQSNFKKAASSFEIANRLVSGNAENLKNLAEAFEKLGKKEEAVLTIKKAESVEPEDEKIKKSAASILLTAEKYREAAEVIRQLGSANKNDCEALDLAGQYSILIGRNDSAQNFASKIKKIDPDYGIYLYSFASRFFQKGNLEAAKENVKAFIDENMKNIPAWLLLGQIDEKLGNSEEALDDFSTAVAFDPNNFLAEKLAKELGNKIDSEKTSHDEKKPDDSALSGSQEISLDEFGFGDDENAASEEKSLETHEPAPDEPENSNGSAGPEDSTEDLKVEDKTDVLALDEKSALFEDGEKDSESDDEISLDEIDKNTDEFKEDEEILPEPEENAALNEPEDSAEKHADNLKPEEFKTQEENGASKIEIKAEPAKSSETTPAAEKNAPAERAEPSESERAEPAEAVGQAEPAEPTEQTEPAEQTEPIEKTAGSEQETEIPEEIPPYGDSEHSEDLPDEKDSFAPDAAAERKEAETAYETLMSQVSDVLPKLSSFIDSSEEEAKFQKEIELFKRLRQFGEQLPFEQRAKFLAGRVRLCLIT